MSESYQHASSQHASSDSMTHDARSRFTKDTIGKGHIGIEQVDPQTQELTRTMIHDPPQTQQQQMAADARQFKKAGHERGSNDSGSHEPHHVEQVQTNTGTYMMEKEATEEEKQKLEQRRQSSEQTSDVNKEQGSSQQLSGEELRERIEGMNVEHQSAGAWVGSKQQPQVFSKMNQHEMGHGHHGPGEGNIRKHVREANGPTIGHTTKAEVHLNKSGREAELAADMAEAESTHRQRQQAQQEKVEQMWKQQEDQSLGNKVQITRTDIQQAGLLKGKSTRTH